MTGPPRKLPWTEGTLAAWWKTFQDPQLDTLIALSLKNNRDLRQPGPGVEAQAQQHQQGGSPALAECGRYLRTV